MQRRIDVLRSEIERLRQLSSSCDADIAAKMRALATEMEKTVSEMQQRLGGYSDQGD